MEVAILLLRIVGFAICVGLYLLLIKQSRRKPASVEFAFVVAMCAGAILYGA